ncbi:hypothetical protein RK21_03514 [Pseudomonas plecoglossicida]|nr:hypothetical protein RK21_03514 [Pseudomonas plecoglossicida]
MGCRYREKQSCAGPFAAKAAPTGTVRSLKAVPYLWERL